MTRTRRSRLLPTALAVVTLAGSAGAIALPGTVAAYTNSSSTSIATQADQALAALGRWKASARVADFDVYLRARDLTARSIAFELQAPAEQLVEAWAGASIDKQHVLLTALTQLGVPYRSRASKEDVGFDCSGLMLFAYAQSGIELPRSSRDQIRAADEVNAADAEPGDLVFYPGHISMYLGLDLMVHSPQSGQDVEVRHLFDRSLRFGDAFSALKPERPTAGVASDGADLPSLVNRAGAVSQ